MNGDAAGSELPELTDEDVKLLDTICKLAARSKEPPSKAIFASYEEVLQEQGIDGRHDSVLFRWVIRLVTPRPGYPRAEVDFVRELRALLEAHGITVVDDTQEDYEAEQPRAANVKTKDRRRVSFDDARYEETWLSNNTQTFDHDIDDVEDLTGVSLHERDAHRNKHARSLSNDRAAFRHHQRPTTHTARHDDHHAFYPSQAELDEAAEAFLDTSALRASRRCLHIWYAATDAILVRQQSDQITAADHDYRMLLKQAWDSVRTAFAQRVLEKALAAKEDDDERRADLFAKHKSTQRFLQHWMVRTEETNAIQPHVNRQMLRSRYFNRWRGLALENKTELGCILRGRYCRTWLNNAMKRLQAYADAETQYNRSIARKAITLWANKHLYKRAGQHHELIVAQDALWSWREACQRRCDLERQAENAQQAQILQVALHSWTQHHRDRSHQSNTAAKHYQQRILRSALQSITQNAKLIPRLHEHRSVSDQRIQQQALYQWLYLVELEQKARQFNRKRLTKHALLSWNDALRVNTLSQRINERLMAEMMYRLVLEERYRLCVRMVQGRLLRESLQRLFIKSHDTTTTHERRIAQFAQDSKRRKLTGVFQRLHMELRKREDAERAAIEASNASLLPGTWLKLRQASEHVQELNKWSRDAAFFVGTKKILDKWRQKTEHSQQEKRRLAYEHVRNRIKARLMRSAFTALRDKTAHVVAMSDEAARMADDRSVESARQAILSWRQHKVDLEAMQITAAQHDVEKLLRSALSMIHTRVLLVADMEELSKEVRAESDLTTLDVIFKRLRFSSFTLARLQDSSKAFRDRQEERRRLQMLRHLFSTAAQRRSKAQDQEPESPSIRPASRAATRSDSRPTSTRKSTAGQSTGTPAYLRTPSRAKRTKYKPIPTPAPLTPFTFTPAYLTTTPAPLMTVLASSPPAALEGLTPQITPFNRKLRASGIATDVRPTSILRPFGRSVGSRVTGTDKSVRFVGKSRFQPRQNSSLINEIE